MYYVYILLSLKDQKFYIGYTGSLNLRLKQHQDGLVKSTYYRRPLKLIYYEGLYKQEECGRKREIL